MDPIGQGTRLWLRLSNQSLPIHFPDILALLYRIEHQDRVASADRIHLERKTIRVRNQKKEVLIASIRLNRLLTSNQSTHEPTP